jgi:hypothetical protein
VALDLCRGGGIRTHDLFVPNYRQSQGRRRLALSGCVMACDPGRCRKAVLLYFRAVQQRVRPAAETARIRGQPTRTAGPATARAPAAARQPIAATMNGERPPTAIVPAYSLGVRLCTSTAVQIRALTCAFPSTGSTVTASLVIPYVFVPPFGERARAQRVQACHRFRTPARLRFSASAGALT